MAATVPEPVAVPEVKEDIEDEKEEPELILEVNRTIFFFNVCTHGRKLWFYRVSFQ